jgi:hypothetical protein
MPTFHTIVAAIDFSETSLAAAKIAAEMARDDDCAHARTLKAFVGLLATLPPASIDSHLRRHDFSRWIDEVFSDHRLAAHLGSLEEHVTSDNTREIVEAITQAIRARYETTIDASLIQQD